MALAKIIITDETNCRIAGVDLTTRKKLCNKFKYEIPGARFTPAVRLGRWDGTKAFCSLSLQTYINLLPEILPILDADGYDVELEDLRTYNTTFTFQEVCETSYAHIKWPPGHERAGQPIMLRDYQVDAVNIFVRNPQSIQCLATGSGKCLGAETEIDINIDETTPFGRYLLNTLQQGVVSDVTKIPGNNTGD